MQVMEASIKTHLPAALSLCGEQTEHCQHFTCNAGSLAAFSISLLLAPHKIIIQDRLRCLDLLWYYTPHYIICISMSTQWICCFFFFCHPLLVCGGRNVVICDNSSCFGTIATGRVGKWFPHKLFVRAQPPPPAGVADFLCMQTLCWLWFTCFSVLEEFIPTVAPFNSR